MPKPSPEDSRHVPVRRDADLAHARETEAYCRANENAVRSGESALKAAVFINGGAAIAILLLVGTLGGHGQINIDQISRITGTLLWFAAGVACGGIAFGFAYLCNLAEATTIMSRERTREHPYVKSTPASRRWQGVYRVFLALAVLAGISSFTVFVAGIVDLGGSLLRLAAVSR